MVIILELEIDKRLYLAALHLYDYIDNHHDEQSTGYDPTPFQESDEAVLKLIRREMGEITQQHDGKDHPIATDYLNEEFGMEIAVYLTDHGP